RALRMLGGKNATLGKRYNLTGADAFSANGYVDTFAAVVGVTPNKVHVPAALMDDLYAGRASLARGQANAKVDIRSATQTSQLINQRFQLTMLVQRIAPHIHHWNRNIVFGIDRLREDVGWRPELTFPSAVEHTYAWFRQQGLHETLKFDWGWEDQLLELARARA
ncbi:MAG: hypothetical protein FJ091_21845, partial [Deltaproteobacteria bacterium]|nr:hypothetical protein [Deltaproteobacteria bacterium]